MFDDFGPQESQSRRLPIYLLLDTSGSMAGAPITAVNTGVKFLVDELMSDPMAIETVYLAVITFDSSVNEKPLVSLIDFSPPTLRASGATSLGGALRKLGEVIDRDIRPNSPEQKGDYKPLVFLMTDGMPTDNWKPHAQAIKTRTKNKVGHIVALGCGGHVKSDVLKEVGHTALLMQDMSPDQIASFFQWVSASVSTHSASVQKGLDLTQEGEAEADLADIPDNLIVV